MIDTALAKTLTEMSDSKTRDDIAREVMAYRHTLGYCPDMCLEIAYRLQKKNNCFRWHMSECE